MPFDCATILAKGFTSNEERDYDCDKYPLASECFQEAEKDYGMA